MVVGLCYFDFDVVGDGGYVGLCYWFGNGG